MGIREQIAAVAENIRQAISRIEQVALPADGQALSPHLMAARLLALRGLERAVVTSPCGERLSP
jgi:hypothetical protein